MFVQMIASIPFTYCLMLYVYSNNGHFMRNDGMTLCFM